MGNFIIGIDGTLTNSFVTLAPEYGYSFPDTKNQVTHRTLSGVLFTFNFNRYKKFEIPINWVNSKDRTLINSWWESNANLILAEDYPDKTLGWKVRMSSPEEPFPQYNRPYFLTQHAGSILCETYVTSWETTVTS